MKKLYTNLAVSLLTVLVAAVQFCGAEDSLHLVINEIYPNPDISSENEALRQEFVEIYNPTDQEIDLSSYYIIDLANHKLSIFNSSNIAPFGFAYINSSNIINNDDETLTLNRIEADGVTITEIDNVSYQNINSKVSSLHLSLSRFPDGLDTDSQNDFLISNPTPGDANELYSNDKGGETDPELTSILLAKDKEDGQKVLVQGKVTAKPGLLSNNYFYIQDDSSGIQIYNHDGGFPVLAEGNLINVLGELSTVSGERRIKTTEYANINVFGTEPILSPQEIAIPGLSENKVGTYVSVSGTINRTSGDTFYLTDNFGNEIKVLIKEGTGIEKPRMRKGDSSQISGILSIYNGALRILPFKQEDVKITSVITASLPSAGAPAMACPSISLLLISLWNLFRTTKKKPKNWRRIWRRALKGAMFLLYMAILVAAKQLLPDISLLL